jgi:16S rRNA (uracil1498-N3)-methyltransferase
MEYFYTTPDRVGDGSLSLDGEEFAHLTHVMRKKVGDTIGVVDGRGNLYEVEITEIVRRSARCSIRSHSFRRGEPQRHLHLGVGILKNSSRFDYLVEKATELGVERITPLLTERTIPRHAKTDRWQKIALAAMKQSGRSVLPGISGLTGLPDFVVAAPTTAMKLLPHMDAKTEPGSVTSNGNHVVVCIGPEGGFTEEEVSMAVAAGFVSVSLGPLRLRTETAALVVAARMLLEQQAT